MGIDHILSALTGALAQLVDGTLGMGFGITCTTMLVTVVGVGSAHASAIVHAAELGTTAASGISHWKFGNISWHVVLKLGLPGAIGAGAGATILSHLSTSAATPWTTTFLVLMGLNVIYRFSRPVRALRFRALTTRSLATIGLVGGFVDATGGGGWGPITSSTLMTLRHDEPRLVVGTVNTAEFLVTAAATIGFVLGLGSDIPWGLVIALMIGGVVVAPLAAWLTKHVPAGALGSLVGAALVISNVARVLDGVWLVLTVLATVALVIAANLRRRRALRGHRLVASDEPQAAAETSADDDAVTSTQNAAGAELQPVTAAR